MPLNLTNGTFKHYYNIYINWWFLIIIYIIDYDFSNKHTRYNVVVSLWFNIWELGWHMHIVIQPSVSHYWAHFWYFILSINIWKKWTKASTSTIKGNFGGYMPATTAILLWSRAFGLFVLQHPQHCLPTIGLLAFSLVYTKNGTEHRAKPSRDPWWHHGFYV